jgi:hypothetical protein
VGPGIKPVGLRADPLILASYIHLMARSKMGGLPKAPKASLPKIPSVKKVSKQMLKINEPGSPSARAASRRSHGQTRKRPKWPSFLKP